MILRVRSWWFLFGGSFKMGSIITIKKPSLGFDKSREEICQFEDKKPKDNYWDALIRIQNKAGIDWDFVNGSNLNKIIEVETCLKRSGSVLDIEPFDVNKKLGGLLIILGKNDLENIYGDIVGDFFDLQRYHRDKLDQVTRVKLPRIDLVKRNYLTLGKQVSNGVNFNFYDKTDKGVLLEDMAHVFFNDKFWYLNE